jgi:hypothetical protein
VTRRRGASELDRRRRPFWDHAMLGGATTIYGRRIHGPPPSACLLAASLPTLSLPLYYHPKDSHHEEPYLLLHAALY